MPDRSSRTTAARKALFAFLATATSAATLTPNSASACCLTDWLYGRQPAYAVAAPIPITSGQPVAPYAAGYAPYTAGYTPLLTPAPNTTALPLVGQSIYSPTPYAVQRPAYDAVPLDNPSVYTGLPVTAGYRGVATPGNSFYGTGNMYPNNYAAASPTVGAAPITAYRADMGSSVALPIAPRYPTPVRSGLARFFDSLLGTGYHSSYYSAPVTYYRPATTFDPVSGTTVTVQQPCTSTVQQLQRTPYATLQPSFDNSPIGGPITSGGSSCGIDPSSGIDPCSGFSPYDSSASSTYGASPIPSTLSPHDDADSFNGSVGSFNGSAGSGDLQPLGAPSLPSGSMSGSPNISGYAPSYSDSLPSYSDSSPQTDLRPLTGSSPSYRSEFESDREPLVAPELRAARPATPAPDTYEQKYEQELQAYRQGYEAGRAATQNEADDRFNGRANNPADDRFNGRANNPADDRFNGRADSRDQSENGDRDEPHNESSDDSPNGSYYKLNPPSNGRPSTEESNQRSRFQIERDERDLRELTTGLSRSYGQPNHTSAPRVQPIPAPEDYRNPFETSLPIGVSTSPPISAPDLLPALPRPSVQFRPNVERSSGHATGQRLSVPVREASIQGDRDRAVSPPSPTRPQPSQQAGQAAPKSANTWQSQVRQQVKDTGWYAK